MVNYFQRNADVSIFVEIGDKYARKNVSLPQVFFVDSNCSHYKDIIFPPGPNMAKSLCI